MGYDQDFVTSDHMYIGELAETVGVNPKTIRYYEAIGLLPEPQRTETNYRVYTSEAVQRLKFIKKAQTLRLALDEIQDVMVIREHGQLPCDHVRSLLTHKLDDLDRQIVQLQAFRRELAEYLDEIDTSDHTEDKAAICPDIESFSASG